jgi:hypothetical protein
LYLAPKLPLNQNLEVNGNNQTFNGQGEKYWDGRGESGSLKPHPMMKYMHCPMYMKSTLTWGMRIGSTLLASSPIWWSKTRPSNASVSGTEGLWLSPISPLTTVSTPSKTDCLWLYAMGVLADGDAANSKSNGKPAAHNTDAFDGMSIIGIYIAMELTVVPILNSFSLGFDHPRLHRPQSRRLSRYQCRF